MYNPILITNSGIPRNAQDIGNHDIKNERVDLENLVKINILPSLYPQILSNFGHSNLNLNEISWEIKNGPAYPNLDAIHLKLVVGLNTPVILHVKQSINPPSFQKDRPAYKEDIGMTFGIKRELPYLLKLGPLGLAPKVITYSRLQSGDDLILMENFDYNLRELTSKPGYEKEFFVTKLSEMIRNFQLKTYEMLKNKEFKSEGLFYHKKINPTPFNPNTLFKKLAFWSDLFKIYRLVSSTTDGSEQVRLFFEDQKKSIWEYAMLGIQTKRKKQDFSGLDSTFKPLVTKFLRQKRIPSHFDLRAQNILCRGEGKNIRIVPCDYQRSRLAPGLWDYSVAYSDPAIGLSLEETINILDKEVDFLLENNLMRKTNDKERDAQLFASIFFGSAYNVGKGLEQRTDSNRYKLFLETGNGEDVRYEINGWLNRTLQGLSSICSLERFNKLEGVDNIKGEINKLKEELDSITKQQHFDTKALESIEQKPDEKKNFLRRIIDRILSKN